MIVRLFVSGRVQGVWYRGWAVNRARELGLNGWVRNRRDGRVEILAEGGGDGIASLVALCWDGPPAARVEAVDSQDADEKVPAGFAQRPTA